MIWRLAKLCHAWISWGHEMDRDRLGRIERMKNERAQTGSHQNKGYQNADLIACSIFWAAVILVCFL